MATDLIEYLNRMMGRSQITQAAHPFPFITISRQTGCQSIQIAAGLIEKLNLDARQKWSLISREIIEEAAQKLQLNPIQVKNILNAEDRPHLIEVLRSLENKNYLSDRIVRKKLKDAIMAVAQQGHVIIVGRAGAIITSELSYGIHLRLVAPFEWRIQQIMEQKSLGRKDAIAYLKYSDDRRSRLLKDFGPKADQPLNFDLVINNAKVSAQEVVEILFQMVSNRQTNAT
jgi:cytidylate kinase